MHENYLQLQIYCSLWKIHNRNKSVWSIVFLYGWWKIFTNNFNLRTTLYYFVHKLCSMCIRTLPITIYRSYWKRTILIAIPLGKTVNYKGKLQQICSSLNLYVETFGESDPPIIFCNYCSLVIEAFQSLHAYWQIHQTCQSLFPSFLLINSYGICSRSHTVLHKQTCMYWLLKHLLYLMALWHQLADDTLCT